MYFVTGNGNKLRETRSILGEDLQSIKIDLPEIQGETPEAVSKEKCKTAWKEVEHDEKVNSIITEDTSLCFNALGGLPGPYVKWFEERMGRENLPKMLSAFDDKSGKAICCVSYMDKSLAEPITFTGVVDGTIVEARGPAESFGWDPIFQPVGCNTTFAEMSTEQKNSISHRRLAHEQLRQYIEKHTTMKNAQGAYSDVEESAAKRAKQHAIPQ
eukprot:GEMP01023389.1.p1 GENE.GEMP01023389.1~~GEMP01023389.1.p1  ORF type:complete len:214 (+),score=53.39 GEMP01023389.1:119-760(+)